MTNPEPDVHPDGSKCDVGPWWATTAGVDAGVVTVETGSEPIADPLIGAVTELLDAVETVVGLLDLGAEAVHVRDDLEKVALLLTRAAGRGD